MKNDCITQENLRLFLSGEITERETLELHLADCASCRRQLALMFTENAQEAENFAAPDFLKEKAINLSETKRQAQVILFPTRRRTFLQWAIAAALIVCFGSVAAYVLQFRQASPNTNETFRQGVSNANSIKLLSPADSSNLSGETIEFRWAQFADAKSYVLTVLDEKGDIIAQQKAAQESFSLNTSALTQGKNYFWFVKANLTDGTAADSDTAKFLFMK